MKQPLLSVVGLFLAVGVVARAAEIVRVPITGNRISADGKWFSGHDGAGSFATVGDQAAIWSLEHGVQPLGIPLGNDRAEAYGISADGSIVAGVARSGASSNSTSEAFVWTAQDGIVGLASRLPGSSSSDVWNSSGVSDDGSTVVGRAFYPIPTGGTRTDIWMLRDGQMSSLGLPTGATNVSHIFDLSADGGVLVGTVQPLTGGPGPFRGFLWDRQNGFQDVGSDTTVSRVSADGDTVAGRFFTSSLAFRWTRESGPVPLPTLPGWPLFTGVYDISHDGSIIVGEVRREGGGGVRAFVWDEEHGTQDLRQLLINEHGFSDMELPQITAAFGISADARTLSVTSGSQNPYTERWAVFLDKPLVTVVPEPSTCALSLVGAIVVAGALRFRMLKRQAPG
jgi:uncharacterized membrane protein